MELCTALDLYYDSLIGAVSSKTVKRYKVSLMPLFSLEPTTEEAVITSATPIETITLAMLNKWRGQYCAITTRYKGSVVRRKIEGGPSNATQRTTVDGVRRFFKWLADEGYLKQSPATRLKLPKKEKSRPKAISLSTVRLMLISAKAHSARDYAIMVFVWDTACRASEATGWTFADCDMEAGRGVVDGKGNRERPIYIQDELKAALEAYLLVRPGKPKSSDAVFLSSDGQPLGYGGIHSIFRRTAERLQRQGYHIGRWNIHSWRHGAAMQMIRNGADVATVSMLLGHSSIVVTRMYLEWVDEELRERHRKYSPMVGIELVSTTHL